MDLGERLSEMRNNRELSVYRLSKLAEVSENYIHEIEKGKKNPSVFVLDKILTSLGITLAEFFNDSNDILYPTPFEMEFINTMRLMSTEKASTLLQIAKYMNEPHNNA